MEAIYPGSFDPFTRGHVDIAKQATNLVDRLHVVVAYNPNKDHLFDGEARLELTRIALEGVIPSEHLEIQSHDGLTSEYIKNRNIDVLVRGLRNGDDLRHETELELYFNETTDVQTVYLTPSSEHLKTSSTVVRRFLKTDKIDKALHYLPGRVTHEDVVGYLYTR